MLNFPSDELEQIRVTLETQKSELQGRIDALKAQDPFSNPDRLNDNAASDMDASEESDHDRLTAVTEELELKVGSIDAALIRIRDGGYGICTNCGKMIGVDRLKALPTATLGADCELLLEKKKNR
jgi:RNA polymerase-binding transcription factor DksA